ncbi:hypothetical protein RB195_011126 [Necator americanus]|uniref:G-protein coupled receptors family 1 profile domain-containing protein n=1 Tax=Necator americanus TaxID=51031 RepID=A0ABR1D117_NECAM
MPSDIDVERQSTSFVGVRENYTVVICVVYLLIGTTSILSNIFNIYVFGRKKSLRRKHVVFLFLEAAEIVNGFAYIVTGAGRLVSTANGHLRSQITVEECFFTKPWPVILLVGTQLPALIVIFASIERTIAVHQPSRYYRTWNYRYKLKRLFLVIVVQMVSIFVAASSSFGLHSVNPSQHCTIIMSTHIAYCTTHFLFVVLAYAISFVTLLSIFRSKKGYNRVNSSSLRRWQVFKKESNLRVLMMTSLMCVVFMSIPALTSILIRWNFVESSDIVLGISIVPPGMISIGTTIVNCVFHNEYRAHVLRIFCPSNDEKSTVRNIGTGEVFPENEPTHANPLILVKDARLEFTIDNDVLL